ncbi:MAG: hypothetical protein SW833_19935 [Cyanobacteriota bacterium]|nr:hypothetical protein [Cyanobacteriota bacterium]
MARDGRDRATRTFWVKSRTRGEEERDAELKIERDRKKIGRNAVENRENG